MTNFEQLNFFGILTGGPGGRDTGKGSSGGQIFGLLVKMSSL